MDTREFAEGYQTPANHVVKSKYEDESPEVSTLMEGPRKWSSFFDVKLEEYLQDGTSPNPDADTNALVEDYLLGWNAPYLYETVMDVRKSAYTSPDAQAATNELHFHVMNREMWPMWLRLINPEGTRPATEDEVFVMQANLALHASEIFKTAKTVREKEEGSGRQSGLVGRFYGQLTEIDTAIVGLELIRQQISNGNGGYALVPAPHKFEAGHDNKRRSADFVFIDTQLRQARGVQVKVRVGSLDQQSHDDPSARTRIYDDDFITLVDGIIDLGNSRSEYRGRGRYATAAAPGLIALDFLNHEMPMQKLKKHPVFKMHLNHVMHGKGVAREYAGNRTPYLQKAVAHIGERLMHDLYKQKTPAA